MRSISMHLGGNQLCRKAVVAATSHEMVEGCTGIGTRHSNALAQVHFASPGKKILLCQLDFGAW